MHPDNPAVYECAKGRGGIHCWRRTSFGAECVNCKTKLTQPQTAEVFRDDKQKWFP